MVTAKFVIAITLSNFSFAVQRYPNRVLRIIACAYSNVFQTFWQNCLIERRLKTVQEFKVAKLTG